MFDRLINANADQRLGIYLNDHRAGSTAGRALAERSAESNRNNELGRYLRETFLPQLEEERQLLDDICDGLGVPANPAKHAAARVAEYAGRFKLNGSLLEYSPLSRIVELEGLIAAVNTKTQMWESLDNRDTRGLDVTGMVDQAQDQLSRLETLHRAFLDEAFTK